MANTLQSRGFHANARVQLVWQSLSPFIVVSHDGENGPVAAGMRWRCSPHHIRHFHGFRS